MELNQTPLSAPKSGNKTIGIMVAIVVILVVVALVLVLAQSSPKPVTPTSSGAPQLTDAQKQAMIDALKTQAGQ